MKKVPSENLAPNLTARPSSPCSQDRSSGSDLGHDSVLRRDHGSCPAIRHLVRRSHRLQPPSKPSIPSSCATFALLPKRLQNVLLGSGDGGRIGCRNHKNKLDHLLRHHQRKSATCSNQAGRNRPTSMSQNNDNLVYGAITRFVLHFLLFCCCCCVQLVSNLWLHGVQLKRTRARLVGNRRRRHCVLVLYWRGPPSAQFGSINRTKPKRPAALCNFSFRAELFFFCQISSGDGMTIIFVVCFLHFFRVMSRCLILFCCVSASHIPAVQKKKWRQFCMPAEFHRLLIHID